MKPTTSNQFEYSPSNRSAFFTSTVVVFLLSICFSFSIYRSRAAGDKTVATVEPQMTMSEDHYINIPYFAESGGMNSTLTLNNNEHGAMTAIVTAFHQKGKQLAVSPMSLQPT